MLADLRPTSQRTCGDQGKESGNITLLPRQGLCIACVGQLPSLHISIKLDGRGSASISNLNQDVAAARGIWWGPVSGGSSRGAANPSTVSAAPAPTRKHVTTGCIGNCPTADGEKQILTSFWLPCLSSEGDFDDILRNFGIVESVGHILGSSS